MWPTDELFNINSNININIILEGKWKESGLCQKHTYRNNYVIEKVKFERLHYAHATPRWGGGGGEGGQPILLVTYGSVGLTVLVTIL